MEKPKKTLYRIAASLVLLINLFGCLKQKETHASQEQSVLYGPYNIVRVVDGDTIVAKIDGSEKKIRLIGVDTPESVAGEEYLSETGKQNTEEGIIASEYTKKMLPEGKEIWIEYDEQRYDPYDRLLAYVYTDENGNEMVQVKLLEEGMAVPMTIEPNTSKAGYFEKIYRNREGEQKINGGYLQN